MKDCYLKARAYVDWLELKEEVERLAEEKRSDLFDLNHYFNGFNLEEKAGWFDCNYKSICATICRGYGRCYVSDSIEVYDEAGGFVGTFYADELWNYIWEDE